MAEGVANFAAERLIRRAPDHPLALGADDQAYLLACLREVERAFGTAAVPDLPLTGLPGRTVMRHLIGLHRTRKPRDGDQRTALGRLAGAIVLLDTACALDHELNRG